MKDQTTCLHAGYTPEDGAPGVMPICQSTTYRFRSTERVGQLFDMPNAHMYSRFSNPTTDAVEKKIAALEGGVGAMCTSSGQAASLIAILNLCSAGDSILSSATIYGGTVNLFAVTLKRFGIDCIFVDAAADLETISAAILPNTKLVFGETIANPALAVLDIEKFARVAHGHNIPLIVDNTFATPILCKPFTFGADIVVHSTTKYMDGHALQVGGVIVDSGNFDWEKSGKFPEMTDPDESYHGISYTKTFQSAAYIGKARMQLMRDFGAYPAAHSSFLLNIGLETLPLRMQRYCENGLTVAEFFQKSDKVEAVRYAALPGDRYHDLYKKYLKGGCCGVVSIDIKGGKEAAIRFMDALQLACNEVHVADIRTCVLHPASATHRQLTDQQLVAAGVHPGLIRFSVGLEDIEDILEDIERALAAV